MFRTTRNSDYDYSEVIANDESFANIHMLATVIDALHCNIPTKTLTLEAIYQACVWYYTTSCHIIGHRYHGCL